ncbi:trypsin-like peptidase domain-containing protein [Jatrophihabitans sp.]|uniref:S1C family serine protease n=1 Tax=Jatrophihabitans sp. TaxID=1932789 RepID=UPI0030C6BB16
MTDFGRPAGVDDGFGPRVEPPVYLPPPPTVPYPVAQAFGPTPAANDGFDPAPGTRLEPQGRRRESPWWRRNAHLDPWRDPAAPYWLGQGAIFAAGRPAQLDPAEDSEFDESQLAVPAPASEDAAPVGRARYGIRILILSVVIAVVAGAIGGGAGYWLTRHGSPGLHTSGVHLAQGGSPANRPPNSVAAIAKRVGPAVVSINVTTSTEAAVGSGVVIDKHGYVLTNNHVVSAAATGGSIVVTFSNEDTAKATIVGRDPVSDLAVLKVPTASLTVASLGYSKNLEVGDPVIAIGSPLGLQGTVTTGIVSALNRPVHVFDDAGTSDAYIGAVQTDAAINPGNSGGALVDASGRVVGINSATARLTSESQANGIGFAIPIDYAKRIAEQLIATGHAVHGSLGANGRSVVSGLQEGAYLEQVLPGKAAANAGLKNGDVVVVADGQPVQGFDQLVVVVQEHKPGDRISVTYLRGAARRTVDVTLSSG